MGTPAGYTHHLRVVRLANDDRLASLLLRLGYQPLDADHVGTGGVDTSDATLIQSVQNAFQLSVRTDDDGISHAQGIGIRCFADAPGRQVLHHMGIVDEVSQHPAASLFISCFFGQIHRPLDSVAKAGAFRQHDLSSHSGAPPTAWPPRA